MNKNFETLLKELERFENEGNEFTEEQLVSALSFPRETIVNYFLNNMEDNAKAELEAEFLNNFALLWNAQGVHLLIKQYGIRSWEHYVEQQEARMEKFLKKNENKP